VTFGAILLLYAAMFGGFFVGAAMFGEEAGLGLGMVGLIGGMAAMIGGIILISAPLTASLYRAMWANLTRSEALGFGAAFSTALQDLGRILGYNVIMAAAVLVGLMFCYVPALGVSLALHFALPELVVHRVSIGEAIALSVRHVRENLSWSLGAWALGMALIVVCSQIPLVGMALGPVLYANYQLRLYRAVFGDGGAPAAIQA
jgi:hypothetical protein